MNDWMKKFEGRRLAIFGSMFDFDRTPETVEPVRIIRVYKSGVRIRFRDGRQETVHPDYLRFPQ